MGRDDFPCVRPRARTLLDRTARFVVAAAVAAAAGCAVVSAPDRAAPAAAAPRLVLQITVDQLRGDFALRSRDRWAKNGFRRLYEHGAVFSDAHHGHANTETIVGHATLATGADPAVHGMVGNAWLDRRSNKLHYNIEDPRYEVVGNDGPAAAATNDGHADVKKPSRGRSPTAMLAPGIADSIVAAGNGKAKVFAVSIKDRGAVPMGGHHGKAWWWSEPSGEFISSTYYYPDRRLPGWAGAWNSKHGGRHIDDFSWELLLDPGSYRFAGKDDMPWEIPPAGMTRTFPHRFERASLGDEFYGALKASPLTDELLLQFTLALLRGEELGRDDVLDYLSVSFSAPDYIGHRYGPDSLELEDAVLRIDRMIAVLLEAVDEVAGAGRTLVVLSADHGVSEPPQERIAEAHDGGHVVLSALDKTATMKRLTKKAGAPFLVRWPPYLYLDNEALRRRHIDPETAALQIAAEVLELPGVEAAYTRGQIEHGQLPDNEVARAVRRNFDAGRSGDIHVIPRPGWQIAYEVKESSQYTTGHGTPWRHDTFVPIVFFGPGVPKKEITRRVEAVDVAPTIAALAGVAVPALATGQVLREAIR